MKKNTKLNGLSSVLFNSIGEFTLKTIRNYLPFLLKRRLRTTAISSEGYFPPSDLIIDYITRSLFIYRVNTISLRINRRISVFLFISLTPKKSVRVLLNGMYMSGFVVWGRTEQDRAENKLIGNYVFDTLVHRSFAKIYYLLTATPQHK